MRKLLHVFVDGACSGNNDKRNKHSRRGGSGVFIVSSDKAISYEESVRLDNDFMHEFQIDAMSNQVSEIAAVYWGMRRLLDNPRQNAWERIVVCTDSMYVKNIFTEWVLEWRANGWRRKTPPHDTPKNVHLIRETDTLVDEVVNAFGCSVTFKHVSAHKRAPADTSSELYFLWYGNDRADRLARDAIR